MNDIENKNFEEILVVSDDRDGLGMEVWQNNELLLEIFRDDQLRTRTITFQVKEISLDKMEEYIQIFKEKNIWDFNDSLPD